MSPTVTLSWKTLTLFVFALLAAGGLLGALAVGLSRATDHEPAGSPQVRVLAEQRDDGRIAVSVQQQRVDGSWGRVYAPIRRLIPANLETGSRLASSPIDLNVDDGTERQRHQWQLGLRFNAERTADDLSAVGDGTVICANLDPRAEGLDRYCDYLDAAWDGTVTSVTGVDPDAFERDLRAAMSSADTLIGVAATNFAGGAVANKVATDLNLGANFPLRIRGSLLPQLMPNREADYCFLTHGSPGLFWGFLYEGASVAALHTGIGNVNRGIESSFYADAEEHSALIRRCIENGAVGIATSLADPDGVRDAMAEARAAGIDIVSFNSGAAAAAELGSALHIAVDEPAIGRKAGEAFTASGVEGDILCIIHEPNNVALSERCDGLDAAYDGGAVEQLPIYAAAVDDTQGRARIIAGRLIQGDVGAVLTLGADAALPTLFAIQGTRSDVRFGAVGFNGVTYEFSARGAIDFIIWDQPMVQGYLSAAALILAEHLRIDAAGWFAGARLTIDPQIFGREDLQRIFNELLR